MTVKILFAVIVALACFGCATTSKADPSTSDLQALGVEKFGHDQFAIAIIPGSAGAIDETLVSVFGVLGPRNLVRITAERLQEAQSHNLDVLFYGSTPAKTGKIVVESLAILPVNSLSGMKIHVMGINPAALDRAVRRVGAVCVK